MSERNSSSSFKEKNSNHLGSQLKFVSANPSAPLNLFESTPFVPPQHRNVIQDHKHQTKQLYSGESSHVFNIDPLPPGVEVDMLPQQPDPSALPFKPPPFLHPPPGYSDTSLRSKYLNPPFDGHPSHFFRKGQPEIKRPQAITEQQAKLALLSHVSKNCCWGKRAAKDMVLISMVTSDAFQYCLETFCEKRSLEWSKVPYSGQWEESLLHGSPPDPWQIPVAYDEKFKTSRKWIEVPHTAQVKSCEYCQACGWFKCRTCEGRGNNSCFSCGGIGRTFASGHRHQMCLVCHGTGMIRCQECSGNKRVRCDECKGIRSLKWFILLTVDWVNHVSDYILEKTDLPDNMIREVKGHIAFQEENVHLSPLVNCPEPAMSNASSSLFQKHKNEFKNEKKLLQRQTVRIIPVTECLAQWKSSKFRFFVFGLEDHVFSEEYPQTCCWGCSIF